METMTSRRERWLVFLIFMSAVGSSVSAGLPSIIQVPQWRPTSIPDIVTSTSHADAHEIATTLTYSENDQSKLLLLALRSEKNESTAILCNYIEQCEGRNRVTGQLWGNAVYALGLVQTEDAKKALMKLWDRHDQQLEKRQAPLQIGEMKQSVPPLRVIGDALHFYLADETTRKWFLDRIAEAEEMSLPADRRQASYWRREDRYQLLTYLYRWDLIDSVDLCPMLEDKNILAFAPFLPAAVTNINVSVDRLVKLATSLPRLNLDITERQWLELRSSPREYKLDSTASLLGMPLAIALWNNYLHLPDTGLDEEIRCRLWLVVLWSGVRSLRGTEVGAWVPTSEERMLLADALAYVETLPKGHPKRLAAESLWGIACYTAEDHAPEEIEKIRAYAATVLESSVRTRAMRLARDSVPVVRNSKDDISDTPYGK